MNDWQNWIVAGVVAAAAMYVLRAAWKVCIAKKRAKGSCGGCTGCPTASQPVITIQVDVDKGRS
jgi:hypothetical protein